MKVTAQMYGQFLVNTPVNVTGTYFADTASGFSHDQVSRFLSSNKLTPKIVRDKAIGEIPFTPHGFVLFDDTVVDKDFSFDIEMVRSQYSGNAHDVIKGIGIVTCVYYNPDIDRFYVLDYRIFDPERDGESKLDHVWDMLDGLANRNVAYGYVLMDSWYAVTELMVHIDDLGKIYYCPLKNNRLVDDSGNPSGGKAAYKAVSKLDWDQMTLERGKTVKVKGFPGNTKLKLFCVQVSTNRTDYVVTNDLTQESADGVRKACAIRWKIEEFHRELKQTTGIEKCQARKQRSQRNHINLCMQAWMILKTAARNANTTIYEQKNIPLRDYVTARWRKPYTVFEF
ncbi:MAG: IS701 family transposase [Acidobacteriota bacterium]